MNTKPTTEATAKPRVLLVDDEPRVCAALAGVLVGEGFDLLFVESSDKAVAAFHDGVFDLVLMDLRMPGKSGWETFVQLTWTRPLQPVIIITALPDQQATAFEMGVGALLEKPLDIPILLETMRRLLAEPVEAQLARIAGRCRVPGEHRLPRVPPPPHGKSTKHGEILP